MCFLSVSNVIYHKFSNGTTLYRLNGKNVNIMLKDKFDVNICCDPSLKPFQQDYSNEVSQHMFLRRNMETIP